MSLRQPSTDQLKKLATRISDEVFNKIQSSKTTIFLCGASKEKKNSQREKIANALTGGWYSFQYDILYPEDLFDELMTGPSQQDLMSMENILAESVDAIVLVPESPGAFAELGAFANNEALREKLICVQDIRYKKKKSFVSYALRLIKKSKKGEIVYTNFAEELGEVDSLRKAISKMRRSSSKVVNIVNVIQAESFVLSSIYLLEPVLRELLVELVMFASETDEKRAKIATTAGLSILMKKKMIQLTPDGYKLTQAGVKRFLDLGRHGKSKSYFDLKALDQIRIDVLSWKYRDKALTVS